MILFLNFAPISFMGGAEKVMLEYAHTVCKVEEVELIDVSPKIANLYGGIVLNRQFKSHIKDHKLQNIQNHFSLGWLDFIPFSQEWNKIRVSFKTSRLIYARFEFLEIALCLYFGGFSAFSKTIAGMHLTPLYASPRGLMDKLHNFLYGSFLYRFFLKKAFKIHVITPRDKKLLKTYYDIEKNIVVLPIGIDFSHIKSSPKPQKTNELNVVFVGELSTRKGVDTLIDIVKESPEYISYNLIGDGPLRDDIMTLGKSTNCTYQGYVSSDKLSDLYSNSDVLLFPSRAEAFGIVMAEAMAHGAKIVNSSEVTLGLPSYIESSVKTRNPKGYLNELGKIYLEKQKKNISKKQIQKFALSHYSNKEINKKFIKEVMDI